MLHLNVASVGRVTVAIGVLGSTTASGKRGSGVILLSTPRAEPVLLALGLGAHLDFTGSRVARQGVVSRGRIGRSVAAPPTATATRSIAVCGRGTKALLALVVTGKQDLEEDGDQV